MSSCQRLPRIIINKTGMNPRFKSILKFIALLAVVFLLWNSAVEFYADAPGTGKLVGKFAPVWAAAWAAWILVCLVLLVLVGYMLFGSHSLDHFQKWVGTVRRKAGWWKWVLVVVFVLVPAAFLLFTRWGSYFVSPAVRLVVLLASGMGAAVFMPTEDEGKLRVQEIVLGFLLSSTFFLAARQLVSVTNFPFALGWSEGNRLYDYSIILGRDRYIYPGELTPVRRETGRLLLWGAPYLIPGSSIWLLRLWNVVLGVIPPLALGFFIIRQYRLPKAIKWAFLLWVFLFLSQGPIYTPLVLSAWIVVLFVRPGKWLQSLIAVIAASYYASSSRFTWLPAVPGWAGIILLVDLDLHPLGGNKSIEDLVGRAKELFKRLLPVILVVGAGVASGTLANPLLVTPKDLSESMVFAQPLLWYRLFPNINYPAGVLGALLIACAPLTALLIWLAASRRWRLNGLQMVGYAFVSLVFLGGGIIASVKIGGGNNLHNMDMFLVTLVILCGLAIREFEGLQIQVWPWAARILVALTLLIPTWMAYKNGTGLSLPSDDRVQKALEVLRTKLGEASQQGEVLFMDQMQLLTFGYIQGITLVPDYEKKYVMDQAMAGDQDYFKKFYSDLANQRFAMIVTDPLFTKIKESDYEFAEENNAWVRWVAQPLLCYYAPVRKIPDRVLDDFDIQLLVPRVGVSDCPTPLQ